MPRINTPVGTSYSKPIHRTDVADFEPDMDTADRLREPKMRGLDSSARDADQDGRNSPRMATSDLTWRPPTSLDAPEPRPGYVQRWIRTGFRGGESDTINIQGKDREGWRPRDPKTIPQGDAFFFSNTSQMTGTELRVGSLVLHEIPEQILRAKRAYIRNQSRQLEQGVASDTEKASREGVRAGLPPIVREERADVTTGRRPPTLAD